MSIINEQIRAAKWLKEYANRPIVVPTREEAIERLTKLGVLLSNGEIAPEYRDFIIEK